MSQELVLKSTKYIDKNNSSVSYINSVRDAGRSLMGCLAISAMIPVSLGFISGNWFTLFLLSMTVPFSVFMEYHLTDIKKAAKMRKRIMKQCKQMGLKLTKKEKRELKLYCKTSYVFEMVLEDKIHSIQVERDTKDDRKQIVKVSKSQDKILRLVVTDALTMNDHEINRDVDVNKVVKQKNSAMYDAKIESQIASLNEALSRDPNFAVSVVQIHMGSDEVAKAYNVLKGLYKKDLQVRINEHKKSQ